MGTMGRSGLQVSAVSLATAGWGIDVDQHTAEDLLATFVDAGGTTIETGYAYAGGAAEEMLGAALATARRDDIVVCSTSGLTASGRSDPAADTSRGRLLQELDTSLSRLRTDHVDLWLVGSWNPSVPVEEVMSALEFAVRSGRARYVGVGGHRGWQLALAAAESAKARIPVAACAAEYSLLRRGAEDDLIDAARHLGVGVLTWSPLAGGVLTGKYRHGVPASSRAATGAPVPCLGCGDGPVVEALVTAARGLGRSAGEVALAWLRERPGVDSTAVGARDTRQLEAILRSENLTVPREVTDALDEVSSQTVDASQ